MGTTAPIKVGIRKREVGIHTYMGVGVLGKPFSLWRLTLRPKLGQNLAWLWALARF